MPSVIPTVRIDTTRLNQGLALAAQYTRRTPAQACNTTAMIIAVETQKHTPFVEIQTIDAQLGIVVSPKIGKRGKPLKKGKVFSSNPCTAKNPDVALAVLIVQARANPNSRYNQLTNGAYALSASPFKGVSRAAGAAAMRDLVHKMIARRHSGTHEIQAGWNRPINILRPFSVLKYSRASLSNSGGHGGEQYGDATPAQQGSANTSTSIENDLGLDGKNAASANRALMTHGAPPLQAAIDGEGAKAMQYYLDKSAAAELYGQVNAAWS